MYTYREKKINGKYPYNTILTKSNVKSQNDTEGENNSLNSYEK